MKYSILTNDKITFKHPISNRYVTVYRIIAEKDFKVEGTVIGIKAGMLGGFIESEANLSQDDNSWVAHNAKVFDTATLSNNAVALSNTFVFGNSHLNHSTATGHSKVFNSTMINSQIYDVCELTDSTMDFSISKNSCKTVKSTLKNTRTWGGSFIKNSTISDSMIGDTPQVINSTVENCKIYAESVVKDQTISNVTLEERIELFQVYPPIPEGENEF